MSYLRISVTHLSCPLRCRTLSTGHKAVQCQNWAKNMVFGSNAIARWGQFKNFSISNSPETVWPQNI